MPAANMSAVALSNSEFLREVASAAPDGCSLWVTAFVGSPNGISPDRWGGRPFDPKTPGDVDLWANRNSYFSVAALAPDENGELRRRKANFARLLVLVADDATAGQLMSSPSYVLHTSPGKTQVGVLLDPEDPDCMDLALIDRLMHAMAGKGLVGMDKHGNNAARYVRLPVGQNQKQRDSGPFNCWLEQWSPSIRLSLDDAAAVFGIDLDACRAAPSAAGGGERADGEQSDKVRAATAAIIRGEGLHDNINLIAASMVASGAAGGAVVNMLRALMDQSAAARDERFADRYADIPRAVASAQDKFRRPIEIMLLADAPEPMPAGKLATETPPNLLTIPGMLGDAVTWINATARKAQPMLAVQAALALGSAVTGRRYRTTNGNWSMLYLLNVAQSGGGKEHAKYAVETLLEAAGLDQLIGAGRFASESGVLSSLIEKPAQFSVLDEFGKMMQSAAVAQNFADRNTLKALMEVWGRADGVVRPVAYSTAGMSSRHAEDLAKRLVRKPSLTMLAMTTPETLFGGVTSSAVADGFLNRFLTVHADRGRQIARTVEAIDPPARLIEWMAEAHAGPARMGNMAGMPVPHDAEPTPMVMEFDAGARAAFSWLEQVVFDRSNELDAEGLAEMLTRTTEIAMRVALIVSVSMGAQNVCAHAAQWACDYVLHHTERNLSVLRERLADGPFDALCKDIRRIVHAAGQRGATERDLDKASRTFRSSPERMRVDALASLQRRDEITLVEITTPGGRGRKRRAYIGADQAKNADNADKTPTGMSAIKT